MHTLSLFYLIAISGTATAQSTVTLLNLVNPSWDQGINVTVVGSNDSTTTYQDLCPATPTTAPSTPTHDPSGFFASGSDVFPVETSTVTGTAARPISSTLCVGNAPFTLIQGPETWEYHHSFLSESVTIHGACTWEGESTTADITCTTGYMGDSDLIPTNMPTEQTVTFDAEEISTIWQVATIVASTPTTSAEIGDPLSTGDPSHTGDHTHPGDPSPTTEGLPESTGAANDVAVPLASMGCLFGLLAILGLL